MSLLAFLWETGLKAAVSVGKLALIIVPLMVIMQVMKDYQWLDRLSRVFRPLGKRLGIRDEGLFPLLVGLIFGISYGSGVIIQSVEGGEMNEKDRLLVLVCLVLCHAVVEDTLVFVAVGANGLILFVTRVVAAFLLTGFAGRIYNQRRRLTYEHS
jgi:hypothetical protein